MQGTLASVYQRARRAAGAAAVKERVVQWGERLAITGAEADPVIALGILAGVARSAAALAVDIHPATARALGNGTNMATVTVARQVLAHIAKTRERIGQKRPGARRY